MRPPGKDKDLVRLKFDLANAYFRKGQYNEALAAAQTVSATGQQDDNYLALLGDIEAHLGDASRAMEIFRSAITRRICSAREPKR